MHKTYYSRTQMCRFPFSWGQEALFVYGRYVARSDREERELDAIIPPLGSNPNIYTEESVKLLETAPIVAQNFNTEAEVNAAERSLQSMGLKYRVQQEAGTVQVVVPQASDVNVSSIDPTLRAEVLGQAMITPVNTPPRVIGPGATKFVQNAQEHIQTGNVANTEPNAGAAARLAALRSQAAHSSNS